MALDLGELEATISVNDQEFDQGLDQAQGRFSQWGDKLQLAAAAAGMLVAGALTMALTEAMEVDNAQAKLAAQLGSETWAKELGKVAGHMYTQGWGESVADNMQTIRAVMSSGLLDEDAATSEIEGVAVKARALADVFEQDVTATARAAGQMVRNGLARDANEAFDVLTRGFQQTGDQAGDMMDTWSEYSTQFRKLGLSGVQAMGLMTQGVKAGARDLDTVADALKEFAIRVADGSTTSADGFKAIGLNAKQMTAIFAKGGPEAAAALDLVLDRVRGLKDPVAREAAAVALFGTKAEDLQAALGKLDLSTAVNAMGDVAGAAEKMAGAVGNSAGAQFESFKRKVKEAIVHEVARAIPYLITMGEWANKNKDFIQPLVYTLGALAVVLGVITAAMKIAAVVQMIYNAAWFAWPGTWIILAVVALVAIFVVLWKKVDWFRNALTGTWNFIVSAVKLWWAVFSGVWKAIGGFFADLFKGWWNLFTGFWGPIYNAIMVPLKAWWTVFSAFWGFIGSFFGTLFSAWWAVFSAIWGAIFGTISDLLKTWWGVFSAMWTKIGEFFAPLFNLWKGIFVGFWTAIFDGIGKAWGWISDKWNALVALVSGIKGRVASAAAGMWDGIKNAFRSAINWIINRWNGFSLRLPAISIPGLGQVWAGAVVNTPDIPYLAAGGSMLRGGVAMLGDRGPEAAFMPAGAVARPLGPGDRNRLTGDGGETVVRVIVSGTGLLSGLREEVSVRGGNVQTVLGGV